MEVSPPEAEAGQIVIRAHRAGVTLRISSRYEVFGVVDSVCPGVTNLRAGDRVSAFTRFGGYAESAVAGTHRLLQGRASVGKIVLTVRD